MVWGSAQAGTSEPHAEPVMLAAIDAGSNAIRMMIAQASGPSRLQRFESERRAVRLGRSVFTKGRLDAATIEQAVAVFRHFAALFSRYGVERYRAVATSAAREAKNGARFIDRLKRETGIRLEVIDGNEEARLVLGVVTRALATPLRNGLILDLGGGSLELTAINTGHVHGIVTAPLGTVRLMETFDLNRAMGKRDVKRVRQHVIDVLEHHLPMLPKRFFATVVGCGGNAETLATIAGGKPRSGVPTLAMSALEKATERIVALDVDQRMAVYGVRRDRAEVMGFAALTLTTLGRMLGISEFVVPAVGVREGIVAELQAEAFPSPLEADEREARLIEAARRFAAGLGADMAHGERVHRLALGLFDRLEETKNMNSEARLALGMAAILHDIGHVGGRRNHHRAGEYLLLHAQLPYLENGLRAVIGCIIRCHGRTDPDDDTPAYASASKSERRRIRLLIAILRLADGLDADRQQRITETRIRRSKDSLSIMAFAGGPAELAVWGARRKSGFLEREVGRCVKLSLRQDDVNPRSKAFTPVRRRSGRND